MSGGIFACHDWGYSQKLVGVGSPTAHPFRDGPELGTAGQNVGAAAVTRAPGSALPPPVPQSTGLVTAELSWVP